MAAHSARFLPHSTAPAVSRPVKQWQISFQKHGVGMYIKFSFYIFQFLLQRLSGVRKTFVWSSTFSHGRRSLKGCSPPGRWGSDATERLHFHFSLSRIGEGNGKPLQCSCLENPRDARAWWAAVYEVTQSQKRLKWLSSSSCFSGEGNGNPLQYSCPENPMDGGAWWAAVHGVARSLTRLIDFALFFHLHALEKEMATHSSTLAWRIPGTEESVELPSMGSHRVGHDWSDLAAAAAANCLLNFHNLFPLTPDI